MGIRVAQGDGGASRALAGFAGGAGERRNEILDQQLMANELKRTRDFRGQEREADRNFTLIRDEAGRDFTTERDEANRDFTTKRDEAGREFTTERDEAGREFELGQDRTKFLDEFDYDTLDDETRERIIKRRQKIRNEFDKGNLDEESKKRIQGQADQEDIRDIEARKKIEPRKTTQADVAATTFLAPDGVTPVVIDKDGIQKVLPGYKPPEAEGVNFNKDFEETKGIMTKVDPEGGADIEPTTEAVIARMKEMRKLKKEFLESETPEPDYGLRNDGVTKKGSGWLGELKLKGGGVATEYTLQVTETSKDGIGKQVDIPTLVPTLTKAEIDLMVNDIIPNGKKPPQSVIKKAIAFSNKMLAEGRSYFAGDEENAPTSQFEDKPSGGSTEKANKWERTQ